MYSICKKEVMCDQSADVNCVPLSDVIVCGTPNLAIQVEHSASAQAEAVIEDRGMASAHRVVQSIMVKMCV
jgi:5-deoxy-D-glucuronate isomerase